MSLHDLSQPDGHVSFPIHLVEGITPKDGGQSLVVTVSVASGVSGATRLHLEFPVEQIARVHQMLTVYFAERGYAAPTRQ